MITLIRFTALLAVCYSASLATAQNFPTKESANSEMYCEKQWTKRGELDQEMYKYCLDKEEKGYQEALILINKYKDQPWIQSLIDFSVKEWTKREIRQDSMVQHSLNKNIEGWEDMNYEAKQPSYKQAKAKACEKKWAPQYSMVSYCYKSD
jgi:hypothetical protein